MLISIEDLTQIRSTILFPGVIGWNIPMKPMMIRKRYYRGDWLEYTDEANDDKKALLFELKGV